MKLINIASADDLRRTLTTLGGNVLFRGQTSHYENDGIPSIVTSFDRRGCIPPVMLKWSRYAADLLDAYLGPAARSADFTQALLQHYGWRSFYIDCSSDAAVSAWFAGHIYSDKISVELCEDYEERPVLLRKRMSRYDYEDGQGYLYVLDKDECGHSIGLIDLAAINIRGARARMNAQSAWLLGPLRRESVPSDCVVAQIVGPRTAFRDFAATEGIKETNDLFPPRAEDPFLDALLRIPWKELPLPKVGINIPGFRRGLDIPEYQDSFRKISAPNTAFYRGAMLNDQDPKFPGLVVKVPEIVLFGTPPATPQKFPHVERLLSEHRTVAFEIDDLLAHVQAGRTAEYQKGLVVSAHEKDLFEVGALIVEHPGLDLAGAGATVGWYYRLAPNGFWERESNKRDCPCDNHSIHKNQFEALKMVESYLEDPKKFR